MKEIAIALETSTEIATEIANLSQPDLLISQPMTKVSAADALDAPIGGEEIRQIVETITVIIKSGAALASFAAAMISLSNARKGIIKIKDPLTGSEKGIITETTNPEEARRVVEK